MRLLPLFILSHNKNNHLRMKNLLLFTLFYFFTTTSNALFAQAGTLDKTFGQEGFSQTISIVPDYSFPLKREVVGTDGKITTASDFTYSGSNDFFVKITRFNADGSLDETFGDNSDGVAIINIGFKEAHLFCITSQTDGKLLFSTITFQNVTDNAIMKITRLNSDGSRDDSFGDAGTATIEDGTVLACLDIHPLSDGRILLVGVTGDPIAQNLDGMVARLTPNGELDPTFGTEGFFKMESTTPSILPNEYLFDVAESPNGSLVVGGLFTNDFEEIFEGLVLRLTSNGELDLTFAQTGILSFEGNGSEPMVQTIGVEVQKDNKVLFLNVEDNGISIENTLSRLNADGSPDSTFGEDGSTNVNYNTEDENRATDFELLKDEQLIVSLQGLTADVNESYNAVARYSNKGILDPTFGEEGTSIMKLDTIENFGGQVLITPDNKIIAIIEAETLDTNNDYQILYRLLNNKTVDIQEVTMINNVQTTPNPATTSTTLTYHLEQAQKEVTIQLIDVQGKLIKTFAASESRPTGRNQEQLDLSSVANGLYFLKIQTSNAVSQVKVVKL
jgi:uncharacterized delta-60 repeat protein